MTSPAPILIRSWNITKNLFKAVPAGDNQPPIAIRWSEVVSVELNTAKGISVFSAVIQTNTRQQWILIVDLNSLVDLKAALNKVPSLRKKWSFFEKMNSIFGRSSTTIKFVSVKKESKSGYQLSDWFNVYHL